MVIHYLPPSLFTAIDVGDALLKRDVLSSEYDLPGLDASLVCQVTKRLAGLSWRRDNAELLQQTKEIQVDPVVGHLPIHDSKDACGGDVDCFASRWHPPEGAAIRPVKAPASGDFVAFSKHILDLVMKAGES